MFIILILILSEVLFIFHTSVRAQEFLLIKHHFNSTDASLPAGPPPRCP